MLAEHLDKLGLNLDVAISGGVEITKKMVVESLHNIGQSSISKILNNKQGDPPLPPTHTQIHTHAQCHIPYIYNQVHDWDMRGRILVYSLYHEV